MKKTIAIIPARGNSKRLKDKNTLSLNKIPLVAHSIIYAKKNSNIISDIYVTTDDPKIKKIALEYGVNVIDRPTELSGDFEPTISALQHALSTMEQEITNVILLQPTNPLRPENLIQDCFEVFERLKLSSLFTVSQNHYKLGKIRDDKFFPFNYKVGQRSQDMEALHFENGLLYIVSAKKILEGEIITGDSFPFILDHIFANVDIDHQEDLEYAQYIIQKYHNK